MELTCDPANMVLSEFLGGGLRKNKCSIGKLHGLLLPSLRSHLASLLSQSTRQAVTQKGEETQTHIWMWGRSVMQNNHHSCTQETSLIPYSFYEPWFRKLLSLAFFSECSISKILVFYTSGSQSSRFSRPILKKLGGLTEGSQLFILLRSFI